MFDSRGCVCPPALGQQAQPALPPRVGGTNEFWEGAQQGWLIELVLARQPLEPCLCTPQSLITQQADSSVPRAPPSVPSLSDPGELPALGEATLAAAALPWNSEGGHLMMGEGFAHIWRKRPQGRLQRPG